MSYLDRIHKKPVEYRVSSENTTPTARADNTAEDREIMSVHDIPMSYFTKREDGRFSMKLNAQSRIAPDAVHEFIIDPAKVDMDIDKDRRSVDLYFKNMSRTEAFTINGKPRSVSPNAYVQNIRALVYKNRVCDKSSGRNLSRGCELFDNIETPDMDYDFG